MPHRVLILSPEAGGVRILLQALGSERDESLL